MNKSQLPEKNISCWIWQPDRGKSVRTPYPHIQLEVRLKICTQGTHTDREHCRYDYMKGCPHKDTHRACTWTQHQQAHPAAFSGWARIEFINIPMKYVYPWSSWVQTPTGCAWIPASPVAGFWIYKCPRPQCYSICWYGSFHSPREMFRSSLVPLPICCALTLRHTQMPSYPEQVLGPRTLHQ